MSHIAWMNGSWLPASEAKLENDDIGFLQSAVIVERIRTFGSRIPYLENHLVRFQASCSGIQLPLQKSAKELEDLVVSVAEKNISSSAKDISIVLLSTPGRIGGEEPTLICMPTELPWKRLAAFYSQGQSLSITSIQNVTAASWSPQIKTRSRLHYYLADLEARTTLGDPLCSGIVTDREGNILDTSISNVAIVEGEKLIAPPAANLLPGLSQAHLLRLAHKVQPASSIVRENISPSRIKAADTVILTGATGCMWFASNVDERRFDPPKENAVALRIRELWIEELNFDFVSQALEQTS